MLNPVTATATDTCGTIYFGKEEVFTLTEYSFSEFITRIATMREVKSGKVANEDKIKPDMSKVLYEEGVRWLTKVCQVAWKLEKATKAWQTSVTISIYKNVDRNKCKNYREISHLNFREKVYANALKVNAKKI